MKISEAKKINYGISILRMFLSLMVVFDHFYDSKKKLKFLSVLHYHIPTFFLLSFFYTYGTLSHFNIPKIKLRFERLIIPYICWSIISWILNNIYFYYLKKKCFHSFYSLLQGLLNGRILIPALWFQNILILITLISLIIIFLFKKKNYLMANITIIDDFFLFYSIFWRKF